MRSERTRNVLTILFLQLTILLLTVGCAGIVYGQTPDEHYYSDSLRIVKPRPVRVQLRMDARTSTYEGQKINIYGYDAGVLLNNKLRLALGYYRIDNDLPNDIDLQGNRTKLQLGINCGALNTEVIFYNARYLSLGFPLEFGFGKYRVTYRDVLTERTVDDRRGYLGFANFGLSATFKPIRWIGLKGIAGYRKSLYPNEKKFAFNGVFSAIGLNVDMQEIIKDVRLYCLMKRHHRGDFLQHTNLITD